MDVLNIIFYMIFKILIYLWYLKKNVGCNVAHRLISYLNIQFVITRNLCQIQAEPVKYVN